jgi:RNA polymerase sigma-70 factor (sigma-E family)
VPEKPEFEAYVAARSAWLHHFAYLLVADRARAEDLVQAALVKAWFAWRRIEGDPDPYVRRIIVNTFASWRRRRWFGEVSTAELPDRGRADESGAYAERDAVWRALRRLPARQRAVLVLRYFADLSQEETAQTLGVSVGTVKSMTGRAFVALRRDYDLRADDAVRGTGAATGTGAAGRTSAANSTSAGGSVPTE